MTTFEIPTTEQATGLWLGGTACSKRYVTDPNAQGMLRKASHRGTTPQL